MKFTTLFALLGSAAAFGSADVKTLALKDQMKSLQTMVKTAQTHKASDMISAITDRKAELEYQLALQGSSADKKSVARELTYLLDLVQNIEQNNFEGATKTLAHRKNKLFKYQMHLAEEEAAAEEEEPAAEGEEAPAEEEEAPAASEEITFTFDETTGIPVPSGTLEAVTEESTAEEKAAFVKYMNDYAAAWKTASTKADDASAAAPDDEDLKTTATTFQQSAKAAQDAADAADKAYGSKSKTGAIIGGIAAAVVLVGGCVYYKKQQSDDAEGGQKEDKKLFKNTFKGNVVKKVQKEALVPTFAVPAEENI